MAISDLTGTKWLINSSCTFPQTSFTCSINFTSNFNDYIKIYIPDYGEGWILYYITNDYIQVYDDFSSNKWVDEAYRTIEITGGEGVTDSKFISWLEENATQIQYIPEITSIKMPDGSVYDIKDSQAREAISNLPKPMVFKGSVGTGGTVIWANLPAASSSEGFTYKVITDHNSTPVCKVGDTIISNGSSWVVIPSGDEPSGTVTSVGAQGASGSHVSVSGSPITSSGTLTISVDSGYSIPSTTDQSTWSGKQDALVSGTNIKTINNTSLLGSGDISFAVPSIGYTKDGYEVTISFEGGYHTQIWQSTKIYSNYIISGNSVSLNSSDEIGSISSASGSTTVTTTTGKLFIYGKDNGGGSTKANPSPLTSSGITMLDYTSCYARGVGELSNVQTIAIDGGTTEDVAYTVLYSFSITADGTITCNGVDWNNDLS